MSLVLAGNIKIGKPMTCCFSFQLNTYCFVRNIYYNICMLISYTNVFRKLNNWERKGNFDRMVGTVMIHRQHTTSYVLWRTLFVSSSKFDLKKRLPLY